MKRGSHFRPIASALFGAIERLIGRKRAAVCHVGENDWLFETGNRRMTAKLYSYG
ncbi:hypothetical protein BRO54_1847 [Geobacillus proteiniphilus]|uniref:Uncharacterized protein n=1 Tax=Geobacillus proteiniphilus TaxID=860353 RepID=A0A1Q5T0K2_9BACL|nr:hypothetical protein BRO54_1847 [Geobacillus proteiniphilus]